MDVGKNFMMVCPKCGKIYNTATVSKQNCIACDAQVVYLGYRKEVWETFSPDEKKKIIEDAKKKPIAPSVETKGSMWIGMLDTILNAVIVLGILVSVIGGGILIGAIGFGGLLVMVLGVILTLLSVAVSKVLIGVASDIRTIRDNTMR